jgi:hypothetical protein
MKKLLIATNIMLLVIISFMACNSNQQDSSKTATLTVANSCMQRFCKTYSSSDLTNSRIRGDLIRSMSDSYANDLGKGYISGSGITFDTGVFNTARTTPNGKSRDALSVVFDIEKLKTLIWLMDSTFCARNCDATKEMGIRFYYIKYPPNLGTPNGPEDLAGLKAENRNKHSLVMVPVYRTKNMPTAEWYDYDLWTSKEGCFNKIFLLGGGESQAWGIGPDPGNNHGGIGPPPEPGTFPTNQ